MNTHKILEDQVTNNIDEIKSNIKTYGFKVSTLDQIDNYYDFANVTGLDSRTVQEWDLSEMSLILKELVEQY